MAGKRELVQRRVVSKACVPEGARMSNDPLHGITLERMLTELVAEYGWEDLSYRIRINCFSENPSIKSSLKFLRRTPWARTKVEVLYKQFLGLQDPERRI